MIASGKNKSTFKGVAAEKHSTVTLSDPEIGTYSIGLIPPTVQNSKTLHLLLNEKDKKKKLTDINECVMDIWSFVACIEQLNSIRDTTGHVIPSTLPSDQISFMQG